MRPVASLFVAVAMAAAAFGAGCASAPPRAASSAPAPAPATGAVCGGIAGLTCPRGDYCRIAPPAAPDKTGVCTARPQMCMMIWRPVCGADHKTYSNSCTAAAAGVDIARAGACAAASPK